MLFLFTIVYAVAVRGILLNRPFVRDIEGVSAYYGILARNYFRYDWSQTLGVPACSMGKSPDAPILYAHHPPLVFLLVAVAYALFGYRGSFDALPPDWQLRLVPACFCVGCIVLIYRLLRHRAGARPAAMAALLFAAMPITIVFGGHADVINPQLVFFCLLTIAAYQNLHARPTFAAASWTALAFIPAGLSDWVAFYLLPILAVHWLYTRRLRDWPYALPLFVIGTLVFIGDFVQINMAWHEADWFTKLILHRTAAGESDAGTKFTFVDWIRVALIERDAKQHTPWLLLLAVAWIVLDLGRCLSRGRTSSTSQPAVSFCRLTLAWGIVHVFVGRQGVYNHLWWWWPLTPGVAIAAAMLLDSTATAIESRGYLRRQINIALVAGLILFVAWYTPTTLQAELNPERHSTDPTFAADDYGRAIRIATPPGRAVILADTDRSVCLWYYGDRPIIFNVWDPVTLEEQLKPPLKQGELPWIYFQPLAAPPAAIVIPRAYMHMVDEFIRYLDAHYQPVSLPPSLDRQFLAYDLTTPAGPHYAGIALPGHSRFVSPSRTASFVSSATE